MTSDSASKNPKPHYSGHRKRLRERFNKSPESFEDYELLELLLAYSIPRVDTKPKAKKLLEKFENLHSVLKAPNEELTALNGLSENTATLIKLISELNSRNEASVILSKENLPSPSDALKFVKSKIESSDNEAFLVIYLNARNRVLAYEIINEGTVDRAVVYPRNIVREALRNNASALILAHNHPSGECDPSAHDIALTDSLIKALKTVDVSVLDHLIIGAGDHFSFAESKIL
ncbi:MAG: DNA repair protein RadC [Victivallales bacterium]|nr:DNA repair protein RadC [Victivallales bacterium]